MRFNHLKSLYCSIPLFILLLITGFLLSKHKVLWFDEHYTQVTAIDVDSYKEILLLKLPDNNKNPLFYIVQKAACDLFSFHLSTFWAPFSNVRDMSAQIITRIPSNLYMSLALSLIFYFFIRYYSILSAFYALSVALASPLVWMYWLEARPYSLWFLLTTIQLLLVCTAVISPPIKRLKSLFVTHLLLALTTPASMLQISIVTFILFIKGNYKRRELALIWALPFSITVTYFYLESIGGIKTYDLFSNLYEAVMPEHLFVFVLYALTAWLMPENFKKISWNAFFLPIFLLFLASALLVLWVDTFTLKSAQGFFSRYLIYLTPADIIMFSLASFDMHQWTRKNPWICLNVSIFLGGLVIIRALMTYREVLGAGLYLHSPG